MSGPTSLARGSFFSQSELLWKVALGSNVTSPLDGLHVIVLRWYGRSVCAVVQQAYELTSIRVSLHQKRFATSAGLGNVTFWPSKNGIFITLMASEQKWVRALKVAQILSTSSQQQVSSARFILTTLMGGRRVWEQHSSVSLRFWQGGSVDPPKIIFKKFFLIVTVKVQIKIFKWRLMN